MASGKSENYDRIIGKNDLTLLKQMVPGMGKKVFCPDSADAG
jgi:hypothetical protein